MVALSRRGLAAARAWRAAGVCTVRHWQTRARASGAPAATDPIETADVPCRYLAGGGGVSSEEEAAQEQPEAGPRILLPLATTIAEGDQIVVDGRTFVVTGVSIKRPTDVYRVCTVAEQR